MQLNGECRGFEPKGGQYTAIFLVNILGSLTFFWCASCGVQFCCSLKVSPDLISRVTDAVLDEVREWQSRVLDRMYPIVIFDALRVKIRDTESRTVKNKAVYVALGVSRDGRREVLGLCPATPIRTNAVVPEAERGGALTGLRLDGLHVLPGPGQVPHCLRVRVGNPDGRETPGTVLTRPHRRIPPVCLDAIRGARGTRPGATTTQWWPVSMISRKRPSPQGPASSQTLRANPSGLRRLIRRRRAGRECAIVPGHSGPAGPMATASESMWTPKPPSALSSDIDISSMM